MYSSSPSSTPHFCYELYVGRGNNSGGRGGGDFSNNCSTQLLMDKFEALIILYSVCLGEHRLFLSFVWFSLRPLVRSFVTQAGRQAGREKTRERKRLSAYVNLRMVGVERTNERSNEQAFVKYCRLGALACVRPIPCGPLGSYL